MDYLHYKVDDIAEQLQGKSNTPLQRAFGKHLKKVARALHDIEWVWSGDYGQGDDDKAIKEVLADVTNEKVLDVLKSDTLELIEQLQTFIDEK